MVSLLWKACAEGDVAKVEELFRESSGVDIEIKDHTGATPLIQAVKNGHIDVVRVLLEKGADPISASTHGPLEQMTSDNATLELIRSYSESKVAALSPATDVPQPLTEAPSQDGAKEPAKAYYSQPHGSYMYYPPVHPAAVLPDGSIPYYSTVPPNPSHAEANGVSNLPPPEIARLIPCRYFPACRYGPSCIFAHPQGPYYQGPLPPPAQYPVPYEHMSSHYPPNFYPLPPSAYPQNPVSPHSATIPPPSTPHNAPPQPVALAPLASESTVTQAPAPTPFIPSGPPSAVPYNVMSPITPTYPQHGQLPVPVTLPILPAHHTHPPSQSAPPVSYPTTTQHVEQPHVALPQSREAPIQPQNGPRRPQADYNSQQPPAGANAEGFRHPNGHRDGYQRKVPRRPGPGFSRNKPACLFFPSGRCRNGDDCRFPHIENPYPPNGSHPSKHNPRRPHQPRSLEDAMANINLQDGVNTLPNSDNRPLDNATRMANGIKPHHNPFNNTRNDKRMTPRQRIPNADDFPVLGGSTTPTPPLRSPALNGPLGPTAAQVLQAPPPARKTSKEILGSEVMQFGSSKAHAIETNGAVNGSYDSDTTSPLTVSPTSPPPDIVDSQVAISA